MTLESRRDAAKIHAHTATSYKMKGEEEPAMT
jgi:hypothetical protein